MTIQNCVFDINFKGKNFATFDTKSTLWNSNNVKGIQKLQSSLFDITADKTELKSSDFQKIETDI